MEKINNVENITDEYTSLLVDIFNEYLQNGAQYVNKLLRNNTDYLRVEEKDGGILIEDNKNENYFLFYLVPLIDIIKGKKNLVDVFVAKWYDTDYLLVIENVTHIKGWEYV